MKNESVLKILFEMVYDCFGVNIPITGDISNLQNSYYAVLSQSPINIVYLVDAIEKRYGSLSRDFCYKYDLRKLEETVELLKELE